MYQRRLLHLITLHSYCGHSPLIAMKDIREVNPGDTFNQLSLTTLSLRSLKLLERQECQTLYAIEVKSKKHKTKNSKKWENELCSFVGGLEAFSKAKGEVYLILDRLSRSITMGERFGSRVLTISVPDLELIKEKVNNNEKLLCRPNRVFRVLFHIHGTEITHDSAKYIIESLTRSQHHIFRLAIVGATKSGKTKLNKYRVNNDMKLGTKFFSSMDQAKHWLVDERFN